LPFAAEDGSLCGVLESGWNRQDGGAIGIKNFKRSASGKSGHSNQSDRSAMLNLDTARKLGYPFPPISSARRIFLLERPIIKIPCDTDFNMSKRHFFILPGVLSILLLGLILTVLAFQYFRWKLKVQSGVNWKKKAMSIRE